MASGYNPGGQWRHLKAFSEFVRLPITHCWRVSGMPEHYSACPGEVYAWRGGTFHLVEDNHNPRVVVGSRVQWRGESDGRTGEVIEIREGDLCEIKWPEGHTTGGIPASDLWDVD